MKKTALFIMGLFIVWSAFVVVCSESAEVTGRQPLIWDDDGSPDGVIALLYLLRHPDVQVKALTVSCGTSHPKVFAQQLRRMLASLGKTDIPVAAGRDTPLEGTNAFPDSWRQDSDGFWGITFPGPGEPAQSLSAAQLIVNIVKHSPEPVTMFVSGTHTNLAEALRLDPTIVSNIRMVACMGGAVYVPGNIESNWPDIPNRVAEWNIWVDPVAVSEVFSSGLPIHLTPLDATDKVEWKAADAEAWGTGKTPEGELAMKILQWMLQSWSPEGIFVWDLMAAINAMVPDLCESQQVHLQVTTAPGDEQGRTVADTTGVPNINLCLTPKGDAMKTHVTTIFNQP